MAVLDSIVSKQDDATISKIIVSGIKESILVSEKQEEYNRLSAEYPGRILLCNRSFILDHTHKGKAIDNTTKLHEVRSVTTTIPTAHPRQ